MFILIFIQVLNGVLQLDVSRYLNERLFYSIALVSFNNIIKQKLITYSLHSYHFVSLSLLHLHHIVRGLSSGRFYGLRTNGCVFEILRARVTPMDFFHTLHPAALNESKAFSA